MWLNLHFLLSQLLIRWGEEELGQSCSGDSNTEAPLFGLFIINVILYKPLFVRAAVILQLYLGPNLPH